MRHLRLFVFIDVRKLLRRAWQVTAERVLVRALYGPLLQFAGVLERLVEGVVHRLLLNRAEVRWTRVLESVLDRVGFLRDELLPGRSLLQSAPVGRGVGH